MIKKENEAAVLAHNDPKASKPTDILAEFDAAVKRYDLRAAIDAASLTPKDATRLLRSHYPKLDKTVVSKCTRPNLYGCVLHPGGFAILRDNIANVPAEELAPPVPPRGGSGVTHMEDEPAPPQETASTPTKKHRSGRHRYTARVAGRLPDDKFLRLQRYIEAEGYETVQDWVTAQVDAFIEKMEAKYGAD